MKLLSRLYKWIIISIILQLLLLYFVNNHFLHRGGGSVEAIKYTEVGGFQLPEGASDAHVSQDGTYIAYLQDGKLVIHNLKASNSKTLNENEEQVSIFRWLPDRAMVIYGEKIKTDGGCTVKIKTYDAKSGDTREYPGIEKLPSKSETVGIELSPLTNVVYAEIKVNGDEKQIYKFDIMDNLSYVMTTGIKTDIRELKYSDTLVYQSNSKKISIRSGKNNTTRSVTMKKKCVLLGVDGEDGIYAGQLNSDGMVDRIIHAKSEAFLDQDWKRVDLSKPAAAKDIAVTQSGNVYATGEGKITNVKTGSETSFSGNLLEILDNNLVFVENGDVQVQPLK